jgi:hypothetical protein
MPAGEEARIAHDVEDMNHPLIIGLVDETTCGTTHDQLCPLDSCNPNELDRCLLVDIAEGPPGDYTNVEDVSNLSTSTARYRRR